MLHSAGVKGDVRPVCRISRRAVFPCLGGPIKSIFSNLKGSAFRRCARRKARTDAGPEKKADVQVWFSGEGNGITKKVYTAGTTATKKLKLKGKALNNYLNSDLPFMSKVLQIYSFQTTFWCNFSWALKFSTLRQNFDENGFSPHSSCPHRLKCRFWLNGPWNLIYSSWKENSFLLLCLTKVQTFIKWRKFLVRLGEEHFYHRLLVKFPAKSEEIWGCSKLWNGYQKSKTVFNKR